MLELALRKQRLQLKSAAQRTEFAAHLAGVQPLFVAADRVGAGVQWLRRHPQVTVAAGVALIVARPRAAWRWVRRGFLAWQAWRRTRAWLDGRGR